jgi:hypothetical protein
MSFTFGFSRTTLLMAAATCALWTSPSAAGGSREVCTRYAEDAFYAVDDMKKAGCDGVDRSGGPGRFTVNYNEHFNWCRNESTEESRDFEKKARDDVKGRCMRRKLKEKVCQQYASDAVEMSRQYQINRCTEEHHPEGRFDWRYQAHYNWCYHAQKGAGLIYDEEEARADDLKACKQRNAENKRGFKRTKVENQSAPDEEGSEEPLQVSDAIDTVADERYTPVSKLKVKRTMEDLADTVVEAPVRTAATEMIVIGNRYVEVPAYSNNDDDSRIGDVVKAGAAAAVVGTAAVATGVVAAKAVDYVDEHRSEIKEAAYDLKDKLKDRLEGSGGFDRVKDGVGALKDKVKERLETRSVTQLKDKLKDRAGGITKAMSGAKEALKSKLKDRSGDGLLSKAASGFKEKVKYKLSGGGGGGGLMKGMAKASGGLLRRLAGR